MKIISTTDRSRYGNDCLIYETINLVEQFGIYATIVFTKISGWYKEKNVTVHGQTTDYDLAVAYYEKCGGKMQEVNKNETLD
jgi:hypothetical protein